MVYPPTSAARRAGRGAYVWLLAANAFLISPIVVHALLEARWGQEDPSTGSLLLTSVLWLSALQLLARRPAWALLATSPLVVTVLADLFLVVWFRSRLTSSYLSIAVSNLEQTPDFVQAFLPQLLGLALVVPLWGLCLHKVRHVTLPHRAWAVIPLTWLAVSYASSVRQMKGPPGLRQALIDVAELDVTSPFGVLPQGFITWLVHARSGEAYARSQGFRFGARREPPPDDRPELYVLVIGESSRPDRWGLNGYERDTSPRLARTPNLLSFTDVVSQAPSTQDAVPLLLTRATADDLPRAHAERSVVTAFKEVGFTTYWLSTQEVGNWTGFIHRYAAEADVRRYFERRRDDVLLAPFGEVLDRLRRPGDRAFVVLHTAGSHFPYENRYPPEFARFSGPRSRKDRLDAAYDNSILFTDHLLAELIGQLARRQDLVSALLFVSDHGENLLDDERRLWGHPHATEYDLPATQFFWSSPALEARQPQLVQRARAHVDRPLSTRHVFHSLVDLAGIRAEGFSRELSIFGEALATPPRRFLARGRVTDFDDAFGARRLATQARRR